MLQPPTRKLPSVVFLESGKYSTDKNTDKQLTQSCSQKTTMTETATTTAKLNKFEKFKAEKDGLAVKDEISEFVKIGWEAMDENDLNHRLKWLGVFFRPVTPGKLRIWI